MRNVLLFSFAFVLFPFSLIVVFNFVLFVSSQSIKGHVVEDEDLLISVLYDFGLLVGFMVVHSLLASRLWKDILANLGCQQLDRLLYIVTTIAWLQFMMRNWRELPLTPVWLVGADNSASSKIVSVFFAALHIVAWCVILAETLIMDLPELFGLKQAYYAYVGCGNAMEYKSAELIRLYRHMRHPGATMLTLILWCHPAMTVTRLVLAIMFTLYLTLAFTVTPDDLAYARLQWQRKQVC